MTTLAAGFAELVNAFDAAIETAFEEASVAELLTIESQLEDLARRIPAIEHRVLGQLRGRTSATEIGAKSWAEVLSIRMLISTRDARCRLTDADVLGPRRTMTGQPLPPLYPHTAAAQARGAIGAEHLRIITATMDKIPTHVDAATRADAEARLATIASEQTPEALRKAAHRILDLLDPDGPAPDEADEQRAARRGVTLSPQQRDGMSEINGWLTPEARATFEPVFAKLAAKGMCNPNDPHPCLKGTPSAETVAADTRSLPQRQHDALVAMARNLLTSGELGQHNGLPVSIVVTTTLQELESAAGVAHTGGDSDLPMRDLIRMAAHSYHYLVVFEQHTAVPLYLGRAKRIASLGQRLVLYARDRGCTYPNCPVPGYLTQVHHAARDFTDGGLTNIDEEALACGPHNRLVKEGGWHTKIRADGRVEWIPPPLLDTGQHRINHYHHPEELV